MTLVSPYFLESLLQRADSEVASRELEQLRVALQKSREDRGTVSDRKRMMRREVRKFESAHEKAMAAAAGDGMPGTTTKPCDTCMIFQAKIPNPHVLPGDLLDAFPDGPHSIDPGVVAARENMKLYRKFLSEAFDRQHVFLNEEEGYDILPMLTSVRYSMCAWFEDKNLVTLAGEVPNICQDQSKCLDVLAHEFTHAMVMDTAALQYGGQPGGIDEHLADVFASMCVQWHLGQSADEGSWLIGQNFAPVGSAGYRAIRDLRNPGTAFPKDKAVKSWLELLDIQASAEWDIMKARGSDVYIIGQVLSKVFVDVCLEYGGNSWEKVGKVWYLTLAQRDFEKATGRKLRWPRTHMHSTCDVQQFAQRTCLTAGHLGDSKLRRTIRAAWATSGVLDRAYTRQKRR